MSEVWILPSAAVDVEWLTHHVPRNATILAMNIHALAVCEELGLTVTSAEDWLSYTEITRIADRALAANNKFTELGCGGERWNDYDLPAIHSHAQMYFFRDVLMADGLARVLKNNQVSRVVWATGASEFAREHAITATLSAILGSAFAIDDSQLQPRGRGLNRQRARVEMGVALLKREVATRLRQPRHADIVACFALTEWARYTDAFTELSERFGAGFQFWALGKPDPAFQTWADAHHTALYWLGYPVRVQHEITDFFQMHWRAWNETQRAKFAQATDCELFDTALYDFYFRPTFLSIWTHLAQWAQLLERHLVKTAPSWLLASSNYDASWSLPRHVAHKLNIRTIALSHSYVLEGAAPIVSDYLACRNRLEADILCPPHAPSPKPVLARNAANALTYASRGELKLPPSSRRIALLVSDEDSVGFMAKINRRAFLATFRQLVNPPPEFSKFQFVLKSHPRADVTTLLRDFASSQANVILVDPRYSVIDLIAEAWLVVLVNYFGSASFDAAQRGKPMLALDSAGHYIPSTKRLPLDSGRVVNSVAEFWRALCELDASPVEYAELVVQGAHFAREWLSVPQQTLGDFINATSPRAFVQPTLTT